MQSKSHSTTACRALLLLLRKLKELRVQATLSLQVITKTINLETDGEPLQFFKDASIKLPLIDPISSLAETF